jgi:hypothetical protein
MNRRSPGRPFANALLTAGHEVVGRGVVPMSRAVPGVVYWTVP